MLRKRPRFSMRGSESGLSLKADTTRYPGEAVLFIPAATLF
jgi:hypothetical protein